MLIPWIWLCRTQSNQQLASMSCVTKLLRLCPSLEGVQVQKISLKMHSAKLGAKLSWSSCSMFHIAGTLFIKCLIGSFSSSQLLFCFCQKKKKGLNLKLGMGCDEVFGDIAETALWCQHLALCWKVHTVSKIIPLTKILRAIYSRREQKDKTTMDLEKRLLSSITIRFEHVESAHALSLATLLDPRYKGKGFERPEKIARAVQLLKEAAEFENKKHPEGSSQCASSLTSQAKRVKFDSR